ncbi:hypothetical protein [Alkalihalobacillus sp. LMS39]|uniref:hypothetical protein n=1 Tax=Alkalihalobacillus sp. LMS39 TaxID=2924032 RepID=UPI001FB36903|nr:hypothetical protein [Alkalihalobacillus sp. LMS39]UOE93596.1 hypothetical protein MM271_20805 [Alkalihalobacillus sp. LMS39]
MNLKALYSNRTKTNEIEKPQTSISQIIKKLQSQGINAEICKRIPMAGQNNC